MASHEDRAEELAERAGGFLAAAETADHPIEASSYATQAVAAATLSVGQRIAAATEAFGVKSPVFADNEKRAKRDTKD
jgi:hypothetical protein